MRYDEKGNFAPMSDRETVREVRKWIVITAAAAIIVSLIGWQVGWWFKAANTDRQVQIDNRNKGTQTAWHDEVIKTLADFELIEPSNTAARGALRQKACNLIPRLSDTYLDETIVDFQNKECN